MLCISLRFSEWRQSLVDCYFFMDHITHYLDSTVKDPAHWRTDWSLLWDMDNYRWEEGVLPFSQPVVPVLTLFIYLNVIFFLQVSAYYFILQQVLTETVVCDEKQNSVEYQPDLCYSQSHFNNMVPGHVRWNRILCFLQSNCT